MTELIIKVDDDFLREAKLKGMEEQYELVRCKDCEHYDPDTGLVGLGICEIYEGVTAEYGFCHHGKRKDGEQDDE